MTLSKKVNAIVLLGAGREERDDEEQKEMRLWKDLERLRFVLQPSQHLHTLLLLGFGAFCWRQEPCKCRGRAHCSAMCL